MEYLTQKKRKLAGQRRDALTEILSGKTAMEYRDEKLEVMENKVEPPDLNTTQTLAKAREEILNKKLGFTEFNGMSISNKKFLSFCNVRTMSLDPFYTMYLSQEQVELWNMLRNSSLPLSFDSTGSVVKKYSFYSDYKSKSLFYYVVVVGFKIKIIPSVQAILSINNVPIITNILDTWLESGAKVPKEIVTDGSLGWNDI